MNKQRSDIMLKKLLAMFTKCLLNFINAKLDDKNHLKIINIRQYNIKQLFQNTLGDFFSNDISNKYVFQKKDYNKNIIKKLINKNKELENIFNKTILECLEHFRGTKNIGGLEGLENEYSKMIQQLEKKEYDEEYILKFIIIIYSVENILYKKNK